jgi:allantoate deiminase
MDAADRVIERCRQIARCTDEPGFITRTFLSAATREVHRLVTRWMEEAGLTVRVDAAGNVRGTRPGNGRRGHAVIVGSHLDTVPRAGAFDGILGVLLGIELAHDARMPVEIVGFSEEEGVRFGTPFLGSLALTGELDPSLLSTRDAAGITVAEAILQFGLDPSKIADAQLRGGAAYVEFHIEQGPVLDHLGLPLAVVEGIVGQSRSTLTFEGESNHAGTTPMHMRRDALAGAAEWILAVERDGTGCDGLTATTGHVRISPGATNSIAGAVSVSLDVRHAIDATRRDARDRMIACAQKIAARRGLSAMNEDRLDQETVRMDETLSCILERAVRDSGISPHRMFSGAGHDAMILARRVPAAMLFLRSPGGISHQPEESVRVDDVAAAIAAGRRVFEILGARDV